MTASNHHSATTFVVAALYKFVALPDYEQLRQTILQCCAQNEIKGSLLLAKEGINGTVAGNRQSIDALLRFLRSDTRLSDIEHKESVTQKMPFLRLKVRLKKEIVTMGVAHIDPTKTVGQYVKAEDWNALISDPDTIVLDTRNDYEIGIGTFKNAIDPETKSFRQFPKFVDAQLNDQKQKKVAMFCTGGIRCEKATAYLLDQGFENVYHLKGGILKYLEQVEAKDSLWQGECFVFDDRVSVAHGLKQGQYKLCHACQHPLNSDDIASAKYQTGVSCPQCFDNLSEDQKSRFAERQHQIELAKQRGEQHLGQFPRKNTS